MAKFIITQADRYFIEANSLQEAQDKWKEDLLMGHVDHYDFIDGTTTYEEED